MAIGPQAGSEGEVLEPHGRGGAVSHLQVSVVTPKGSVLAHAADEIVAPGVQGEFGVLPGHIPFLSALRAGVLTLRAEGNRQMLAVGPGYLEVGAGGTVQVLVEMTAAPSEIDVTAVNAEREKLQVQLRDAAAVSAAKGAAEPGTGATAAEVPVSLLQARLAWADARIAAANAATAQARH
jgi:F-type H+-transporting ATPase subunit epsilon